MPFNRGSGQHYTMRARRQCKRCKVETWQLCTSIRYRQWPEPTVPASLMKELSWVCEDCGEPDEEVKQVYEPTDRIRIINRLLNLSRDYDFISVSLSSQPNEIVVRIQVPDFDPSELRSIQTKQQETGFINVGELMQLQKAGFRRPSDVPPKPQPKDRRTLRERARQRMFQGEPRSI
jgi:hypothetical protein